jgi:hypothetical protein
MIYVVNHSGWGNRIKNIVSALRTGHLTNDMIEIHFEYLDLFLVAQCIAEPRTDYTEVMSTWGLLLLPDEHERKILREPLRIMEYHDRNQIGYLENRLDYQYFNIEPELIAEYLRYFALIRFRPEVLAAVDAWSNAWSIGDQIGVHVRTWFDAPDRFRTLYDIEDFFAVLDTYADTRQFVVCVDHDIARSALIARYGRARILEPANRAIGHIAIDPSRRVAFDSLVDMLLLARCHSIVGTYQSTFTECAWWLGGARQAVHIPVPKAITALIAEFERAGKGGVLSGVAGVA